MLIGGSEWQYALTTLWFNLLAFWPNLVMGRIGTLHRLDLTTESAA